MLVSLEVARYAIDLAKFKREASYHMWSSKLWGLLLFFAFFGALVAGPAHLLVALAIYMGIIADVEGIMISFVLREWKNDVQQFSTLYAYDGRLPAFIMNEIVGAGVNQGPRSEALECA